MIYIKNKKFYIGPGIYVGRSMPGLIGSPLRNPFKLNRSANRNEVYRSYDEWLNAQITQQNGNAYTELLRIAELARKGDVTLICWCAPDLCHANAIAKAVEYLNSMNTKKTCPRKEIP